MRKLFSILFVLALILSFAVTGYAQDADLVLSDVEAKPGDTFYLTVKLQTQVTADALGLSYTYDDKVLAPMPADSWSWEAKGAIKNFDIKNDRAVWAANEPVLLLGDVCVMAFRVLENAKLTQTKVTCELIVKNQGEEVGTFAAEGIVGQRCEHEYTPWDGRDSIFHTSTCELCGKILTQTHMWDDGVETTVDGNRLMRYTCTTCHETDDVALSGGNQDTKPTGPAENPENQTIPTTPVIRPNQDKDDHTHEEETWDTTPTAPDGQDHEEDQNVNADMQTDPTNDDHINVDPTEEYTHDHPHEETQAAQNAPVTGIVVGVALAVLLGAAVYFVKKK